MGESAFARDQTRVAHSVTDWLRPRRSGVIEPIGTQFKIIQTEGIYIFELNTMLHQNTKVLPWQLYGMSVADAGTDYGAPDEETAEVFDEQFETANEVTAYHYPTANSCSNCSCTCTFLC